MTQHVYRCFDAADKLLYVGVSSDVRHRLASHRFTSVWFAGVHRTELEEFSDREEAREAERRAILAEQPLHNVRHKEVCNGRGDAKKVQAWLSEADLYALKTRALDEDTTIQALVGSAVRALLYARGVAVDAGSKS